MHVSTQYNTQEVFISVSLWYHFLSHEQKSLDEQLMSEIINIRAKPAKLFRGPTYDRESSQGSDMRLTCHERAQLKQEKMFHWALATIAKAKETVNLHKTL